MRLRWIGVVAGFLLAAVCGNAWSAGRLHRPRLAVVISIDQFRADYLMRFEDLYLPARSGSRVGGFRYLMERGAWFVDAHHDHLPLATGPGHSVLLTGAYPYKSGIVSNDWYDREAKHEVYCVRDDRYPLVGTNGGEGVSPARLLVTTVGDELKMATGNRAKVFGIALKDRAAVLMAGHLADGVYWFDDKTGGWVTSRYWQRNGTLPSWLVAWNERHIPQNAFGKSWNMSVDERALRRLWTPNNEYAGNPSSLGTHFPHRINGGSSAPGPAANRAFATTPFANEYTLQSALRLVQEERLGQHEVPDLLVINLSSNDYIGHAFGPDSAEVLDTSVRTDRYLADFLNGLAVSVPGGLASVDVVVTADHGVAPIAAAAEDAGLPGGRWDPGQAAEAVQSALVKELGPGKWVSGYGEPCLYLNWDLLDAKGVAHERAERIAAAALAHFPGIYAAYTRTDVLAGRLPRTDIARHVTLGFHPARSGDVVIVSLPGYMASSRKTGTTHGEPYAYDTHVPILIAGFGIKPGVYTERVSTADIAPTLAWLLRVQEPSGCDGHILRCTLAADAAPAR
ncbi:MAG: alkaline phosphatase family protein [Chthonomonadales bacterium]